MICRDGRPEDCAASALDLPRKVVPLSEACHYLIPGETSGRMLEETVRTAWQPVVPDLVRNGALAERFTLHDRKAKGISDSSELDRRVGAGHLDGKITERVYNRKPQPVKPSGKE